MLRMSFVTELKRRGRNVVAAAPLENLRLAVLLRRLSLVEALKSAVVPLVESPRLVKGNPGKIHLLRKAVVGVDGARKHRCVSDVKLVPFFCKQLASLYGLLFASRSQLNIVPASEAVGEVPRTLSVTDEYNFIS